MGEMNAAVLHGREDVRIERLPVPHAGPGELVVRVYAALTCGTDLKVYRRGYHAKMLQPPILFGHEMAGVITEAGAGVRQFREGDRVVALNSAPCGQCYFCLHHQENLCDDLLFNNGAYAEYIRIPARIVEKNTLPVPPHVPLEHAAMTEPLACVLHGLDETGIRPGDSLAIIGAGPIGLMFIHLAAQMGAEVIALVKREEQAVQARSLGAAHTVQAATDEDAVEGIRTLTGGRGADAVVEAVATPETWQLAVALVRKGGAVNFFGGCAAGTTITLDTNRLHYSSITMRASFHHRPPVCRRAFDWIASERFDAARFLTGRAPLEDLVPVLRRLMDRRGEIKTALFPGGLP